jgi:hypothetical protein
MRKALNMNNQQSNKKSFHPLYIPPTPKNIAIAGVITTIVCVILMLLDNKYELLETTASKRSLARLTDDQLTKLTSLEKGNATNYLVSKLSVNNPSDIKSAISNVFGIPWEDSCAISKNITRDNLFKIYNMSDLEYSQWNKSKDHDNLLLSFSSECAFYENKYLLIKMGLSKYDMTNHRFTDLGDHGSSIPILPIIKGFAIAGIDYVQGAKTQ